MKKKLIKFFVIPLSVFVVCLFAVPAYLLAGPDDALAEALDAPSGAEGDITSESAIESDQATTFPSFGNIDPKNGPDFTFLSTGDAQDNESGASGSTDFGSDGVYDWVGLDVDNITAPKGAKSFTFDYYYMTNETSFDHFFVLLYGSSDVPPATEIAFADSSDASAELYDMDGTAFENMYSTGWVEAEGLIDPGDNISLLFYIEDTTDGILDSAVILDNFKFQKKKKAAAPPPPVRTMPMTCYQVWVTENPGHFAFIFRYEHESNNWVQIFDMDGNMVWEIDFPHGEPYFEADLPDGMYKVQTFHEAGKIIQEFIIGK
ncbi:T9SS type A sorting domain-containing protein [Actinomycetota bacterium]